MIAVVLKWWMKHCGSSSLNFQEFSPCKKGFVLAQHIAFNILCRVPHQAGKGPMTADVDTLRSHSHRVVLGFWKPA